jgi:uncharacterized pyridoxamine 5'-phosphate oxidase family protein
LLQIIPNIKCYILNPVPSKHVIQEPVIALVAIDHQMAMIQVQVKINFIEEVLLDGGF